MANGGNTRRPVKNADKKAKKKSENRQNSHKRMFRWFLFGVFFSCTPLIVSISINWYLGYETITSESGQIKYLADFILVVFAVATNACGYATDGKIRVFLMVISIGSMAIAGILYIIFLSNGFLPHIIGTFVVVTILGVLSSFVGFIVEIENRKEAGKKR